MFEFTQFFNPTLLWLAAGALAPIVIHLATRSRPRLTPFPAVRFIVASHRHSSAKFKLKQLLLLLLRIAALALFALVLARPWMTGVAGELRRAKAAVTAVFLLDNSYSMGYATDDTSAFEKAKATALAALDTFAAGESRVCLFLVSDTPQPVITDFEHAFDLDAARRHIRDAKLSHRGTDCTAAVERAVGMLEQIDGPGKAVFLFTDLTARSWPATVPAAEGKDAVPVYVADVGAEDPVNPAVLQAEGPPSAPPGSPFEVKARVDAVGSPGRRVELVIDGNRKGHKPAGDQRPEQLSLIGSTQKRSDEHWGRVTLTGRDPLPVDNSYAFTFRSHPERRVLLVNGAPSSIPRRDELHFLRTALAPEGLAAGQPFLVSEVPPGDLEETDLAQVDVVALCNVGEIGRAGWMTLRRFVSRGYGLLVFGGDHVTPEAMQPAVSPAETALLPCSVGPAVTSEQAVRLEPGTLDHPILRPFEGGRNGDLARARFHTYHRLDPNEGAPGQVVLAFKNGDPAIVAGRYGTGTVLVFASSCDMDWNTLPREVPYVILMQEALKFLAGGEPEQRDILAGSAPSLRLDAPKSVRSVALVLLPDREPEDVTERLDEITGRLNLPPIGTPGVYRVRVERGEGRGSEELLFAVNLDTSESDVRRLSADELAEMLLGREVGVARSEEELLEHISRGEAVSEVSSHVAGLVLFVLLAEMGLSNRMRRRAGPAEA